LYINNTIKVEKEVGYETSIESFFSLLRSRYFQRPKIMTFYVLL